ncbi:MAG: hypothetical protein IIY21_11510 [Clostridiales bacterium]|nr:hypothetical protein [Clostridiales bacterium]
MTREEQLACLKDRPCSVCKFHTDGCSRWTCVFEDEPEEQEPKTEVLDKIRAEILEACGYSKDYVGTFDYTTTYLKIVLQIIDKYTAESEVPT